MSELVLTIRKPLPRRLDGICLDPSQLMELPLSEIERLLLTFKDGDIVALADLFAVSGSVSPEVRIVGDASQIDDLGGGMTLGVLRVEGNVGGYLGEAMISGRIEVAGDAGRFVGREMQGGEIVVRGNVGDGTGGGSPGSKRGMTGGEIVIFGDAGEGTGACLRRGVIAVGGTVGPGSLRSAIAGTLVAFGDVAAPAGRWSKRASLIAFSKVAIPDSYEYSCRFRAGFVRVLLLHLQRRYGFPISAEHLDAAFDRFCGDFAESGRGEILQRAKV